MGRRALYTAVGILVAVALWFRRRPPLYLAHPGTRLASVVAAGGASPTTARASARPTVVFMSVDYARLPSYATYTCAIMRAFCRAP